MEKESPAYRWNPSLGAHRVGIVLRRLTHYDIGNLVTSITTAALLAGLCAIVLLPRTAFEPFAARLSISFRLGQMPLVWTEDRGIALCLTAFLILGCMIWRYRILRALTVGSRPTRLMTGALLSLGLVVFVDLFTSGAGSYYYYGASAELALLLAFVLGLAFRGSSRRWHFLLGSILVCSVLQSLYALVRYALAYGKPLGIGHGIFHTPGAIPRAVGTMESPNSLYPICLISAILLVSLAVSETRVWLRLLYLASALVSSAALLLTFSRAGGLGLAVGLIYLAYTKREVRWLKVPAILGIAVLCVMLVARAHTKTGESGMDRSALGRVQIWRASTMVIRDNWLLGAGYTGYKEAQDRYTGEQLRKFNPRNGSPQNLFLTMQAYHGVLGTLVLVLSIYATWMLCKNTRKSDIVSTDRRFGLGIGAAGVGLVSASLVDTPVYSHLYFHLPATFIWLCCMGFLLHLELRNNPPSGEWRHARALRKASLPAIGLVALAAGFITIPGIIDSNHASKTFDAKLTAAEEKPSFVSSMSIPDAMKDTAVATEDNNFYYHHGYSLVDMHRALRLDIRAGRIKQGGSTVTQQLAKNLFFSKDRTLRRKVAELIMAVKLEHRLKKPEILEAYLNVIDFGLGAKGIGSAAWVYFGKDASQLTDAECALLAGLVCSPPKERLAPDRARAAIKLTIGRLENVNYSRWSSVQSEINSVGESQWLAKHLVTGKKTTVSR